MSLDSFPNLYSSLKHGKLKLNKEYQETILAACDFDKGHFVIATKEEIRILRKSDFKKVGRCSHALTNCHFGILEISGEETIGTFQILNQFLNEYNI